MKLKELKKILDKMTPEELDRPVLYNSDDYCISGQVKRIGNAKSNLYYTGDDDPSQLRTKKELKERGYTKEEIAECLIEIKKGDFVIHLD